MDTQYRVSRGTACLRSRKKTRSIEGVEVLRVSGVRNGHAEMRK